MTGITFPRQQHAFWQLNVMTRKVGGMLIPGGNRNADWCLSICHFGFFFPPSSRFWVLFHVVHLFFWQDRIKMAEGSKDQGGVGTTDPEEDSPNMIVYRKVKLTLCMSCSKKPRKREWGKREKFFTERHWPLDRLLTAHRCASMCNYHSVVLLSNSGVRNLLHQPSWNKFSYIFLSTSPPLGPSSYLCTITSLGKFSPPMF